MEVTEDAFEIANARGKARQAGFPAIASVRYDRRIGRIVIAFVSGLEVAFAPRHAQGLEHARPDDLADIEVTPSGLGLHFPRLDADLYLPALLDGLLGSRHWLAAEAGRRGGVASTEAKAAAARRNGRLGGRPRKSTAPTDH